MGRLRRPIGRKESFWGGIASPNPTSADFRLARERYSHSTGGGGSNVEPIATGRPSSAERRIPRQISST